MKADATQQRALLELAQLDAELTRIAHRAANLPEQQRCDELEAQQRVVADRVAVLSLALEDLEGRLNKLLATDAKLDPYTRAHLKETASRIHKVLEARLELARP